MAAALGNSEQVIDGSIVAIAVAGARSQRAVRWASENLIPHASRVVLIHVVPPLSIVPSPSGNHTPVEEVGRDVLRLYEGDRLANVRKNLGYFKKLCQTRREVEIVVLVGEDPSVEILRYLGISGIKNLVLGDSTFTWISRTVKGLDVPGTVLRSAPDSCNVFLVSRWKLIFKLANKPDDYDSDSATQIRKTKLKMFTQRERSRIFEEHISRRNSMPSQLTHRDSALSVISDLSRLNSQISTDSENVNINPTAHTRQNSDLTLTTMSPITEDKIFSNVQNKIFSNVQKAWLDPRRYRAQSLEVIPSDRAYSPEESGEFEEIERLRMELDSTQIKYSRACKDLIIAKKKVETLSAERSEEARKVQMALEREQRLRRTAEEEKARHLEALREIESAKQILAQTAIERHKAEIRAMKESSEKQKIVDSLFSSDRNCKRYSEEEIIAATDNFSPAKKIGEGGYGNVYRCNLDHTPVAIKVLNQDGRGNKDQFLREVEVLTRLNHPHLVLLLGVCPEIQCLVYEYMDNGSLDDRLFCKDGSPPLPWDKRFRIILEVACGLAFLHGSKPNPIVHCDMKPGNILLDQNYVSKIGDVGLARFMSDIVPDSITEFRETQICGTMYYVDPEYQRTGTLRPKSDLYAFGIIVLQILTARHPLGLLVAVENAIGDGSFAEILDPSVREWPLDLCQKLAELALKCSSMKCKDRPDLESEVIAELEEIMESSDTVKRNNSILSAPSHYFCPILKQVMEDPYIAEDGFTYEKQAIEAWFAKHNVSPVTKLRLDTTNIIPNHTLRLGIQDWKSRMEL